MNLVTFGTPLSHGLCSESISQHNITLKTCITQMPYDPKTVVTQMPDHPPHEARAGHCRTQPPWISLLAAACGTGIVCMRDQWRTYLRAAAYAAARVRCRSERPETAWMPGRGRRGTCGTRAHPSWRTWKRNVKGFNVQLNQPKHGAERLMACSKV